MARIWTESYKGQTGPPFEYWGGDQHRQNARSLVVKNVLMVHVASFTFHFFSIEQIRDCLEYYEKKTHPSSRLSTGGADHWEMQRWFERLPMYLLEEPRRAKVVKALGRALALAQAGAFSGT
jgi:hypothetical protein